MPDIKTIVLSTPAEALEDVLSPFIEEQFPSFMRSDYRKLILFIKAYYEWSEQQNNPSFVNQKVGSIRDVDNSLEEFYSHFKNMYLDGFPEQLAINVDANEPNKRTLIKKIKNFYGNKGTESAYRFLFRVLFDSGVEFYNPKNYILRASDGEWVEEISIKVTRSNEDKHQYLLGGTVEQYNGLTLLGYANIDRVFKYYQSGIPVTELFLTNLVGSFTANGTVFLNPQENSGVDPFTETAFSVLGEFFVQTPGENYRVGDTVYVTTGGVGFSAKVEQTGLAGAVKRIKIENSGVNYFTSVTGVVVSPNGSNNTATILFTPSAITRYPGYYKGNRGKVSSTQKLYDGDLYQEFSYQLKSAVSIDKYYAILRQLIHPAGMKMFGSILLENTVYSPSSGSSQVTRVGIPVLGNYTPYTLGTTFDLRANGVTAAGAWVFQEYGITYGSTGDLYPLGYNPYIESAGFTGPNGRTAPVGTLFRQGGSGGGNTGLGYTYCFVPENGRTAHRPLGAPLGGYTAWALWYESKLTPDVVGYSPKGIVGLTLWLKPENIGVCGGSLVTGASMDIWRDASLSQNHALPPKWDLWDNETVLGIAKSSSGTQYWNQSVWNTNACDNIEFRLGKQSLPVQGVSFDKGNAFMVGFWGAGGTGPLGTGGNNVNLGYQRLDFAIYVFASDFAGVNSATPRLVYMEYGRTAGVNSGLPNDGVLDSYKSSTVFGISHDKTANTITYYKKDTLTSSPVVLRTYPGGVSAGEIFYADSSWFNPNSRCEIVKAQNNGVDLPISGWTGTSSMQFAQVKGLTIDKLRPTLIVRDRGITGCTGIQFNGGVIYGPHTVWLQAGTCGGYATGKTLGAISSDIPFAPGSTGEKILSGQFFSLTNGLTLTKDMTAFIVFRAGVTATGSTAAGYTGSNYGLGLVSSAKKFLDFSPATGSGFTFTGTETDHAFYHRSYYDIDIDPTKQTTSYYFANSSTTESLYPYDTGLVGLRSNVGSTGALRMAYDPYTSTLTGITAQNISIGEWRRETDSRIRTFYSGDESKNLSIITARRIARPTSPGGSSPSNIAGSETAYNSETISLGRFGAYCLPVLDCPYGVTHASFVNYALANPSYSFKGVIYEVVVYDRVLTESERQTVYGYLSRKYNLDPVMPLSYATSHPSATLLGYSYWDIAKHPNAAGSAKILAGTSFGNITIQDFLSLYGIIYRSAGTRLSDGTVLTQDTYTVLGE